MELRQLRHFIAVVKMGSFSRAAEEMNLTQQALSKSVHTLEESLGVILLERSGKTVKPTVFGELLLAHAQTIEAESRQFLRKMDEMLGTRRGHVNLGVDASMDGGFAAEAVHRLMSERPGLTVDVEGGHFGHLTGLLLSGELDVVVSAFADGELSPALAQEALGYESHSVVARPEHPLARHEAPGLSPISLNELAKYPWISMPGSAAAERAMRHEMNRRHLSQPPVAMKAGALAFLYAMLSSTDRLAALPDSLTLSACTAGLLARLSIDFELPRRPYGMIYRQNGTRAPAMLALMAQFQKLAAERRGDG